MTALALHDFHLPLGARFREMQGTEAVADYGDPAAEYRAVRRTAGVLDLSGRGRLVLLGADRQKLLNGQVTNNVRDLRPGQGCYAFMVTAKAKILADLTAFALPDEILLDLEPGVAPALAARLDHFIVADDVQVVDATPLYGLLSVQGPRADRVLGHAGLFASLPAEPLGIVGEKHAELGELYVANHARTGSRGYDVFAPVAALGAVAERLLAAAGESGGRACGWEALETVRVEAGIPRYGADMDETTLAPETGAEERAISYTKGCYSGQEVIARIRTYGQVARALRGLRLTPADPAALPARGTRLFRDGKDVGHLTTCRHSPELGADIALGYVRRECNLPGTELRIGSADGAAGSAEIVPLPFVGPALA